MGCPGQIHMFRVLRLTFTRAAPVFARKFTNTSVSGSGIPGGVSA